MKRTASLVVTLMVVTVLAFCVSATGQAPLASVLPELTAKRIHDPGWWPTKGDAARKDYAGTEACAECHQQEVTVQQQTSMARAASRALDTEVLRSMPKIALDLPPFVTTITRDRKGSTYTVGRGAEALSGQVAWTMGDGTMGQTFIVQSGGNLFESQLTYFPAIHGLDLTPGHLRGSPQDLEHAFGELQSTEAARQCFACHTTISSTRGQFDPAHATPGIICEACHGPGIRHIDAMHRNQIDEGKSAILNPAQFSPAKLIDYCGACHRAPLDVTAEKDYVPINVRFQPYRLSKSRCWSQPDNRISCTACHNPHEQVVRDSSFYDAKCLACHAVKAVASGSAHAAASAMAASPLAANKLPACPVSTNQCTSCHMPRYKVPQMHGSFTDHDIRIVRAGDPYPL